MLISLFLVPFAMTWSCEDADEQKGTGAFLGGQILNPTSDYLILSLHGEVIDSALLDDEHRFMIRIDSAENGLYTFKHPPETQNVYIEQGDSILLRANTLAFDESLHFSGSGSDKNNLLSEMFVLDESNSSLLLSFYDIEPVDFLEKTDSIRQVRLERLDHLNEKFEFSEKFVELATKTIDYEMYDLRERYTYLINKYYRSLSKEIPEEFHDYREAVNFNDQTMICSPGYLRFIENYLINFSLDWCAQSGLDKVNCFDLAEAENIKTRIRKAAELLELPALEHHFLYQLGVSGMIMSNTREDLVEILELIQKYDFPKEAFEELRQLGTVQLAFLPGMQLQNVRLINLEGEETTMGNVIDRHTIIFLWSIYSDEHEAKHREINNLRKKYPEIDFIGVNLDLDETSSWQMAVEKYGYKKSKEFQLESSRIKKHILIHYLDKLLFVDPDGTLVIGDSFLYAPEFEDDVLEFLNR